MPTSGDATPLSRRTRGLIAIPVGTVLALVVTLGAWALLDRGDGDDDSSSSQTVTVLEQGQAMDPAAVWALGFDVVRLDIGTLQPTNHLGQPFTGSVIGSPGALYFYAGPPGRVARFDTATTTLLARGEQLPGYSPPDELESMAATDESLYLVTGAANVTILDAQTLDTDTTIGLGVAGAIDTTVASTGADVYAVTQTASDWVVSLVRDGAVQRAAHVAATDAPVAVAADATHLWVLTASSVVRLSTLSLADPVTIAAPAEATPLHTAAAANGALWFTGGSAHDLYSLPAEEGTPTAIPLVERSGTGDRVPVSVVAGRDAVFAMVQASDDPEQHDVVISKIDPETGKVTHRVALPSDLFPGAIAVS